MSIIKKIENFESLYKVVVNSLFVTDNELYSKFSRDVQNIFGPEYVNSFSTRLTQISNGCFHKKDLLFMNKWYPILKHFFVKKNII